MLLLTHFTKTCTKCKELKVKSLFMKDRHTSDGYTCHCKECKRIHRNNDKLAQQARTKAWYIANKEDINIKNKEWKVNNKELTANYYKEYYKTSNGKAIRINSKHRRRSLEKSGDVTNEQLVKLQQDAKLCYWCKCSLKNVKVHIDHYVPLSKGGKHTLSNLVVSCNSCNQNKNAKDPIKFAQSIGRLL